MANPNPKNNDPAVSGAFPIVTLLPLLVQLVENPDFQLLVHNLIARLAALRAKSGLGMAGNGPGLPTATLPMTPGQIDQSTGLPLVGSLASTVLSFPKLLTGLIKLESDLTDPAFAAMVKILWTDIQAILTFTGVPPSVVPGPVPKSPTVNPPPPVNPFAGFNPNP